MPELRSAIRRLLRGGATDDADEGGPRPKRRYLADAVEGVARVRAAGHDRPMVLATWPFDRGNPFQALLTSRVEEFGIVPVGMDRLADLDDPVALPALARLRADGVEVVLHLHWLARVLRGAESEAEGRERVTSFLGALDAFRDAGGRLVWTVHNVLPHDTKFPTLDLELRKAVVERVDIIHVLSAGTVEAAAPLYAIPPDKVLHVPHPAYLGVYPDDSDAYARRHYGIGADDIVFGVVGNLRPYKGLDDLLDAFESITASPPDARRRRLVIAGTPVADPSIETFLARARSNPDVVVEARRLPAEELSLPLRASDVIVLPYRDSLNSGALLLALSFGRPVIAAASPHVSETVGPDASITFDPDDRDALLEALRGADRLLTPEAQAAALATARRFDPAAISERFAKGLRERLLGPSSNSSMAPQVVLRLIEELEAEVNNGGFDQFFFNAAGDHAEATIRALKTVGALEMADIVRRACARFPGGMPPANRNARQARLELLSPDSGAFEQEDADFLAYPDDLASLVAAYSAPSDGVREPD